MEAPGDGGADSRPPWENPDPVAYAPTGEAIEPLHHVMEEVPTQNGLTPEPEALEEKAPVPAVLETEAIWCAIEGRCGRLF